MSSGGPSGNDSGNPSAWDLADWLAVLGTVIFVVGFVLPLLPLPQTRSAGILVPFGMTLMAVAAYAARQSDRTGT
jgi:hypothetical protein